MRLFLIRHPPPQVAAGVCYGSTDLPLAEDAAACAARVRPLLPAAAPVFASPLQRCRRLAEALHAAPRYDARLRELDFGRWEMRAWRDVARAEVDAWAADPLGYDAHGGESVAALHRRVVACVREIAARHAEAVLVTHAGPMKAIAAEWAGLVQDEWLGLSFAHGAISLIDEGTLAWRDR